MMLPEKLKFRQIIDLHISHPFESNLPDQIYAQGDFSTQQYVGC
jgi:hypothetical protein